MRIKIQLSLKQAIRLMQYFNIEAELSIAKLSQLSFLEFQKKKEMKQFLKEHKEYNREVDILINEHFEKELGNEKLDTIKTLSFSMDTATHIQSILAAHMYYLKEKYINSDEEQTKDFFEVYEQFQNPIM